MRATLAIFDCDGTLYSLDEGPFWNNRLGNTVKNKSAELLALKSGASIDETRKVIDSLVDSYNGELSQAFAERFGMSRKNYFEATWGSIHPSSVITENRIRRSALEELREANIALAVLSNAPEPWTRNVLSYLEISSLFTGNVWNATTSLRKPQPESYLSVVEHFNLHVKDVVHIGDEPVNDIEAPKALGMLTAHVTPFSPNVLADYHLRNIQEVPTLWRIP